MTRSGRILLVLAAGLLGATGSAAAQDAAGSNLQVLPQDIQRDSLVEIMRGFSFALGVRCQYCHVGGDGVSFEGVDFASDEDPDKRKARFMLRMVETLNHSMLPLMADRDAPSVTVGCKTCHRGSARPELLTDVLRTVLDSEGPGAAAERYTELREQTYGSGMYDFGEWEMNVLGERLADEGRTEDAIAVFEINLEQYPQSLAILMSLGGLHERVGDTEQALARYRAVLEVAPGNEAATARIAALGGNG